MDWSFLAMARLTGLASTESGTVGTELRETAMWDGLRTAALIAATVTMGLAAGLFYTFSVSVMLALRGADDRTFVDVMRRINVAIINGWFMVGFLGALLLTGLAAVLHLGGGAGGVLIWVAAALVLYGATFVITVTVHVPLNNALGSAGPLDVVDLAAVRESFERRWVRWNIARAVLSTAALGCLSWALVLHGRLMAAA
jgi:uncharacterized membrane protein